MWCPLPWTHLSVKNNGALRLCSHSQSVVYHDALLQNNGKHLNISDLNSDTINCDTLKKVRKEMLEGKWPDTCKRCMLESNSNMNSRDKWETERHKDTFTHQDALRITLDDGTVTESNLQDFDIRIGNFCNLRCVMCFPGESSLWYKDYKEIHGKDTYPLDGKQISLSESNLFDWFDNSNNINKLLDSSSNVLKINFGGGEPTIIKKHKDFLQGLVDRGYSNKIELEYSINVTTVPPALIMLWENFKQIQLCCSIDAHGEANEAIRYPTKWSKVESNLKLIDQLGDNIHPFISTTINILSLEHFINLQLWIDDQHYVKINKQKRYISHIVNNPIEYNFLIFEQKHIDIIFDQLYKQASNNNKMLSSLEKYSNLYKQSTLDKSKLSFYRSNFVNQFYKLSKNQNQNFAEIFPLANIAVQEWNT